MSTAKTEAQPKPPKRIMINDSKKTIRAARSLALQDLKETSDEEIRSELISEGIDPSELAAEVAARLSEVIATNHGKR